MKAQRLLVLLVLLLALVPVYGITKWLQKVIQPRRSFAQLMLYMLACLLLVFVYTFFLTLLLLKLFPVAKG